MKRLATVAVAVSMIFTLSSCASADQGDGTACELYESGFNDMWRAVLDYEAHSSDHDAETYRVLTRAAQDQFTTNLNLAVQRATDADVLSEIARSRDLWVEGAAGNDDAGVAFFLGVPSVAEACAAANASIELIDR